MPPRLRKGFTKSDDFSESSKGGEIIFSPKIYIADFGNFKQGFLSMKLIKSRVISGFRVCFFNNCIEKNQNGPYL